MATTFVDYTGDGNATKSFSFPSIKEADIKVEVDNVLKTSGNHYNITSYTTTGGGNVVFTSGNIPASPAAIRIFRDTDVDAAKATFVAGSSVKAGDLNNNMTQVLYAAQEEQNQTILTSDIKDAAVTTAKIKDANVTTAKIAADNITAALIADDQINSEHYVDGSIDTAHIADSQITTAKIADNAVTTAKIANDNVVAGKLATDSVTTLKILDANVTTPKIADSAVTTAKIANDNVTAGKLGTNSVTTLKIAADAVTSAKIADGQVNSEHIANGSIDAIHLSVDSVETAKIEDGAVTTAKIAHQAITSDLIQNGGIVAGDLATNSITTDKITDANITTAKLADDAVTSAKLDTNIDIAGTLDVTGFATFDEDILVKDAAVFKHDVTINGDNRTFTIENLAGADKFTVDTDNGNTVISGNLTVNGTTTLANGSIGTAEIAADAVTGAKIADAQINSEHYVDGSIDTAHIASAQVTDAKLASNSVITSKITDANVTTVKIADSNITLAKLASDLKQTSISDSDTQLPTSGAVVDYVAAQIAPLGGLEVVATEVAFPNTQPSSGVVISISDAGGIVVNGSGVSTTGRTVGGSTVTINNFPSSLQNKTMAAGVGLMVSSTGSSQTYNYHKLLAKEADVEQLSNDINDFAARYRVGSSNPTSNNDAGDLFFNTGSAKLLVYNATNSAWEETQTVGNFFINTISSSSGTGGGSATFNGSAYRFTISNAGTYAQQHIVSINGVIQKPNTGTSVPNEGFAIDGGDIIFSSPPASGADYFIITVGASVSIGTPSDGTVSTAKLASGAVTTAKLADANVTTAKIADDAVTAAKLASDSVVSASIVDGSIVNADVNASAAIAGTKIDPSFTSNVVITNTGPLVSFVDSNNNPDYVIQNVDGTFRIRDTTNSVDRLAVNSDGHLDIAGNVDCLAGLDVTGDITVSGTVDGVDIAALNTTVGNITTDLVSDTSPQLGGDLDTNSHHISLDDDHKVNFGDSNDFSIQHTSAGNYLEGDSTGSTIFIRPKLNEESIKAIPDGAVELYHNNSKKFETSSVGATVTGQLHVNSGYINVDDNYSYAMGTNNRAQLYHSGSHQYLLNTVGSIFLQPKSGESGITIIPDDAVELFYDNSLKLETTSFGVCIGGNSGGISGATGLEIQGAATSEIRMKNTSTGSTGGDGFAIQQWNNGSIYIWDYDGRTIQLGTNNNSRWQWTTDGHYLPYLNNAYDIGSSSKRVRNIYTNDLHLSNNGSSNDMDGTWGDWTIQEGESDLFLKNNRSGKKYKFNLTEVS